MNDDEIEKLKMALAASEPVYWAGSGKLLLCVSVIDEWYETYHDGSIDETAEPAAELEGGQFVALYECHPNEFIHTRSAIAQNT
jgi:hypothetical protein